MIYRPPVILAVDPGASCGVAVLVNGVPILVRTVRGDRVADVAGVIQFVSRAEDKHGKAVVVIERQFMGRGAKANPKSLDTLNKRRFVWEIVAELYRLHIETVYPATWQTVLSEEGRFDDEGKKLTTKAKARRYSDRHFPGRVKDKEQADALAMALWRWRKA